MFARRRRLAALVSAVLLLAAAAAADASAAGARPHASPRSAVVAPAAIASDCSQDVTAALTDWLQSLPDGTTAQLRARGCYRIETEVLVHDKTDFHLDGRGAVLQRTQYTPPELRYPHANAFLRAVNWHDSGITNLRIKGTDTTPDLDSLPPYAGAYRQEVEFDHGISLHGVTNTTVDHVTVRSVWGDGIWVGGHDQYSPDYSDHVVLSDDRIVQNGRQGISLTKATNVVISGARIRYSRRAGIDLEPPTDVRYVSGVEIMNSRINSRLVAISAGGAGAVDHINVHDNVIGRTGTPWVFSGSSSDVERQDWVVRDNVVTSVLGSPVPAMKFRHTHGIVIEGNVMSLAPGRSGLAVGLWDTSDGASISCNTFIGAGSTYVDDQGQADAATVSDDSLVPALPSCATSDVVGARWTAVALPGVRAGAVAPIVGFIAERLGLAGHGDTFDDELQAAVADLQGAHGWRTTGGVGAREWKALLGRD